MKKMLSSVALAVVLAMVITTIPVTAFAASDSPGEDYIILETVVDTTIRKEASSKAEIVSDVSEGTLLVSVGSVTNRYGNVWFSVIDISSGTEGYIFSGKTQEHRHVYEAVEGDDSLKFCRCGNITQVSKDGGVANPIGYALPVQVIDPDTVMFLAGVVSSVGAAASAALPYIAVATVFGVTVALVIEVAQNSVTVKEAVADWTKLDADFKPDEGVYYHGMTNQDFFFIDIAHPIDEYEAMDVVESSIHANKLLTGKKPQYWFIYTVSEMAALALVEDFVLNHRGFTSNYTDECHTTGNSMRQFRHLHIVESLDAHASHLGGHILFGAPQCGTFTGGAWA